MRPKPSGRYVATDLHSVGFLAMKMLVHDFTTWRCPDNHWSNNCWSKCASRYSSWTTRWPRCDSSLIIQCMLKGHLAILRGNSWQQKALKQNGIKSLKNYWSCSCIWIWRSLPNGNLVSDSSWDVIVIRVKVLGGPGMRKCWLPPRRLLVLIRDAVGLITDGRFSGGTMAWWICSP